MNNYLISRNRPAKTCILKSESSVVGKQLLFSVKQCNDSSTGKLRKSLDMSPDGTKIISRARCLFSKENKMPAVKFAMNK